MIRTSELIASILKEELPRNIQLWTIVNQRSDQIVAARELEKYCLSLLSTQRKDVPSFGQNILFKLFRNVLWVDVIRALQDNATGNKKLKPEVIEPITLKAVNSSDCASRKTTVRIKSWN